MAPPAIEDKILVFVTATDAANIELRGEFIFSMAETSTGGDRAASGGSVTQSYTE